MHKQIVGAAMKGSLLSGLLMGIGCSLFAAVVEANSGELLLQAIEASERIDRSPGYYDGKDSDMIDASVLMGVMLGVRGISQEYKFILSLAVNNSDNPQELIKKIGPWVPLRCMPDDVAESQARQAIKNYLHARPRDWSLPVGSLVKNGLEATWPCK